MNQQQQDISVTLPLVRQAKKKYFYFHMSYNLLGTLLLLILNSTRETTSARQILRLLTAFAYICLGLLYSAGYQSFSRVVFCVISYVATLCLISEWGNFAAGGVLLLAFSISMRNHFLFEDNQMHSILTVGSLVGDALFLLLFARCEPSADRSGLSESSSTRIWVSLGIVMLIITICVLSEVYIDDIRQKVYNQLKDDILAIKLQVEEQENFIAAMSHEIRNPLQSLLGSVELLQLQQPRPGSNGNISERLQDNSLVGIIKSCCDVVLNLVSNILDASKIDAQKLELSNIPSCLNENIQKILRLSRNRAEAKGLQIVFMEPKPLPPSLLFDPQRLQQVVLNIVSNAIKFTQKGRIVVKADWVPLQSEGVELEKAVRTELSAASWKSVFEPLEEGNGTDLFMHKMRKVTSPFPFFPSKLPQIRKRTQRHLTADRVTGPGSARNRQTSISDCQGASVADEGVDATEDVKSHNSEWTPDFHSQLQSLGLHPHNSASNEPDPPRVLVKAEPEEKEENYSWSWSCGSHRSYSSDSQTPLQDESRGLVKIEIMDSGIGISKEGLAKLFNRYQQADATISQNYGGTGLGLWISRSIIRQMGGDIRAKSKPGKGTDMIVVFPSETVPETPMISSFAEEYKEKRRGLSGKKCLIVDDIPDNTFILDQVLRSQGMLVVSKTCGRHALKSYRNISNFDLIITDLRMPGMSGQDLILAIRKFEREKGRLRTPILVLTGEALQAEKVACLSRYGADEYLLKPVKMQCLMDAVEALLTRGFRMEQKKKVLVVDDDTLSLRLLMTMIRQGGDSPTGCRSVYEAKAEISANPEKYDVILLDSQLQDGNGLDFVRFYNKLVVDRELKAVPIVSMSGNGAEEQTKMYEGFVMHGFLQKPISKSLLLGTIRSLH